MERFNVEIVLCYFSQITNKILLKKGEISILVHSKCILSKRKNTKNLSNRSLILGHSSTLVVITNENRDLDLLIYAYGYIHIDTHTLMPDEDNHCLVPASSWEW